MRVIRFPGAAEAELAGLAAGEQIDAALNGEVAGADAAALRELREDVRALAAAVDAEFERELQAHVAEWGRKAATRRPLRARLAPPPGTRGRLLALGGAVAAVTAVVLALALGSGGGGTVGDLGASRQSTPASLSAAPKEAEAVSPAPHSTKATRAPLATSAAGVPASSAPVLGGSNGRLQQLAAAVTLAAHGGEGVQEAADAVTRLAATDGGYVESSHVQVRQGGGSSEAQLRLSVPSAKLSAAIAALGRIAPVRAVSQESQDITSGYEAAKRRLADDEAVRRALLHALAAATSEGQIDSLREQLAANRAALSNDRGQLHSISHTAATSALEVTITGSGAAGSGQSTLDRGLHDAGHVLAVAGAVALVALAVVVPLALLALVLDALRRAWTRRRREAVLGP